MAIYITEPDNLLLIENVLCCCGRIKPDIIACGMALLSARSNAALGPSCVTLLMSGTSMSSPAAAGAAALVVQYFQDSLFWKAVCNPTYKSCRAFTPSGVLIKALLLHSAVSMRLQQGVSKNFVLGQPPDYTQAS